MATRIRLKRIGRKNRPFYRIVVMDSRQRRDGAAIEELGWYNPISTDKDNNYKLNEERIFYWLETGAQPSEIAHKLMKRAGITFKWHLMKQGLDEKAIAKEIQKLELRRAAQAKEKLESAEKESKKKVKKEDTKETVAEDPVKEEVKKEINDAPVEEAKSEAMVVENVVETKEKVEEVTEKVEANKDKSEVVKAEETDKTIVTEEKPAKFDKVTDETLEVTTTKKSTPKKKTEKKPSAKEAKSKDEVNDDK